MKICLRYLLPVLVLLLLGSGLAWLQRDRLADAFLRPWLAEKVAAILDAEVAIGQIKIAWLEMTLSGLNLSQAGGYELQIEKLLLRTNDVADLLAGRLSVVELRRPQLFILFEEPGEGSEAAAPGLPPTPPLIVEHWMVADGQMRVAWPGGELEAGEISASGELARRLTFQVTGSLGQQEKFPLRLTGRGTWQDQLSLTLEELIWRDQALLPEPVTFNPAAPGRLSGRLSMETLSAAEAENFLAAIAVAPPWPGDLSWRIRQPSLAFRFEDRILHLQLTTRAGDLQLEGRDWSWRAARLQIERSDSEWHLNGSLELAADSLLEASGRWNGDQLTADWHLQSPQPGRLLQALPLPETADSDKLSSLDLRGRVEGGAEQVRLSDGRLTALLLNSLRLDAALTASWQKGELAIQVEQVRLFAESGSEALAAGSGRFALEAASAAMRGQFQATGGDLNRLGRALGADLPAGVPRLENFRLRGRFDGADDTWSLPLAFESDLAGQGMSGRLAAELTVRPDKAGGLRAEVAEGQVSDLEYANPEGTVAVTGIHLTAAGSIAADGELETVIFDLQGKATAGEALVESWYGDLQGLSLQFVLPGRWQTAERIFFLADADIGLGDLLSARLQGRFGGSRDILSGKIEIEQLAGDFQDALQRLAADLLPQVRQMSLAGSLSADLRFERWPDGLALDLDLLPDNMTLAWGEMLRWQGLAGTLPLRLRWGDLAGAAAEERNGRLEWQRLQGVLLASGPGALAVQVAPNHWQLTEPVGISAAGGNVELRTFELDLVKMVPHLQTSVRLTGVELEPVSRALAWPVMTGQLHADLKGVKLDPQVVGSEGGAEIRVFGGDFQVSNIRIEAPLSRFPTYHADVGFRGVDLAQLTRTFSFGEINGIADGSVEDLRLFNGLPSAFAARFETREQGERNISVKAIRNLNTLSQGGLSAALSSGIYQFIDFYRYRKIGFLCSLENDVFYLEGTARSDSDQYLVDGGWLPPKIDVIISSPTISFKEMVKRLKRIERTEN